MFEYIRKNLPDASAALITSNASRRYLSGFEASDGYVLLTHSSAVFFADSRYIEAAEKQIKNMEVSLFAGLSSIKERLEKESISCVLIETTAVTIDELKAYKKAFGIKISKSQVVSRALKTARMLKNEEEIKSLKMAQKITDAAFSHILKFIKAGVTEKKIALELEFFMRNMGSEGVSFETIVVSGSNGSLPHGVPSDRRIKSGDLITMDFGAVINGYHSDMTRTVAVGEISKEQREAYETVLKAQNAALKTIKAGEKCAEIDGIAREIINKNYSGAFSHALGHSVGLEIHEEPNLSPKSKAVLKENMVLTVEPGIYLQGEFGIRIEDMVVVRKNGIENLTKSPKDLIVL